MNVDDDVRGNVEVPKDWKLERLGGLCIGKGAYGANVPKAPFDPSLPRYVRITDISADGRLSTHDVASIDEVAAAPHILEPGDVLLARSGATVGKSYVHDARYGRCAHAGYLIRFRTRLERLLPGFLKQYLASQFYWKWVGETQRAQAQPNINAAEYASLSIPTPPLGEQRKIAAILSSVDDAIEATQAVIGQLQVVKKAMMSELLTRGMPARHTKFKMTEIGEVPEEWDVVELGDVLESIDSGWSPQCEGRSALPGEWGVLKVSAVTGGVYRDSEQKALPHGLAPRTDAEVAVGDVLLARANGVLELVGKTVLVRTTRPRLMLSDKLLRLRAVTSSLHAPFLALAMTTDSVRSRLLNTTGGSHMRNVSQSNLRALRLPLPSLDEQRSLAAMFDVLEERLSVDAFVVDAQRELKAALTSVLLTGEFRVKPDEESA